MHRKIIHVLEAKSVMALPSEIRVFSHRGFSGEFAENTIPAIQNGFKISGGVELDVQLSKDGVLVVFHDDDMERLCGVPGAISDYTFKELQQFPILDSSEHMPTLNQVLALMEKTSGPGRLFLNIELKGKGTASPVYKMLMGVISETGLSGPQFDISSFETSEMEAFSKMNSVAPLGVNQCVLVLGPAVIEDFDTYVSEKIRLAQKIGATAVNIKHTAVSKTLVNRIHEAGMKCQVYTVDDPESVKMLIATGVDGFFSNYPNRFQSER
jgi:glycerophosphoryl diester phosphodiesterase